MHSLHGLRGLHSLHGCNLRFIMTNATAVECSSLTWSMGRQIWREKRNFLRDKTIQIPQDMLVTPTWQRITRFQLQQTLNKDVHGHLWEPGEFSLFKRKPLSLIFGIRNNKFIYFIYKIYIFYQILGSNLKRKKKKKKKRRATLNLCRIIFMRIHSRSNVT